MKEISTEQAKRILGKEYWESSKVASGRPSNEIFDGISEQLKEFDLELFIIDTCNDQFAWFIQKRK